MIKWRKSSPYSITSDCGDYVVTKAMIGERARYTARFMGELKEYGGKQLACFNSPEEAKAKCQEHKKNAAQTAEGLDA